MIDTTNTVKRNIGSRDMANSGVKHETPFKSQSGK
jgi:hypothetical protein